MNCHYTLSRLSPYLDGELRGDEMLSVRAHLQSCPQCNAEFESASGLKRLVGSLPEHQPAPGFQETLLASVRSDGHAPSPVQFWPNWKAALAFGFAAACVFAVLRFNQPSPTAETVSPATRDVIAYDQDWNMAGASFPGNAVPASLELGGR